jgi:glycosyltransferase involved in cell wall biosynthesis
MKTLIVIPCFNEEKNIENLVNKVKELNYDYLIINDNSNDNSEKLLNELDINHIHLPNNMGLANVTKIGFKYANDYNYDSMIVIDGDGQHPPKYINNLIVEIDKGFDYVVGSRFVDNKKPITSRMIGSRLLCFFIKLKTGVIVSDPTSGMRAFGKNIIKEFSSDMNFIAEPDALVYIIRKKYKIKEVQVDMVDRQEGVSYFQNPLKGIKFMFMNILSILLVR